MFVNNGLILINGYVIFLIGKIFNIKLGFFVWIILVVFKIEVNFVSLMFGIFFKIFCLIKLVIFKFVE